MKREILLRLDDICPDINHDKFIRIKNIFLENGIIPIIGVIPDNKYQKLKKYRNEGNFMDEVILLLVPQTLTRWIPFGRFTICLHANAMDEHLFNKINKFVKNNRDYIVSLQDIKIGV